MRGVVMAAPGDVRVEKREDPRIIKPTDAVLRLTATCICGSDRWAYRGVEHVHHTPMGHEYVGAVEEIGDEVKTVKVGDFVVGSFVISDNTCEICQAGYPSRCVHMPSSSRRLSAPKPRGLASLTPMGPSWPRPGSLHPS
jgi:threonine dehydrogenase-like Zn-dependent dehydrogenase